MTSPLRTGIVAVQAEPTLSGEVECDEVYEAVNFSVLRHD